jgi:release factor glutamine methyltransferase
VAVALKHDRPDLEVWAADISEAALETARSNARRLLPDGQNIILAAGDLFAALTGDLPAPAFSLITANPPYVQSGDIAGLAAEVRQEPLLALDGGSDGLDLIRRIITEAPRHLSAGGFLALEADPRQMRAIGSLLQNRGFGNISVRKDLAGLDRVISARYATDGGTP